MSKTVRSQFLVALASLAVGVGIGSYLLPQRVSANRLPTEDGVPVLKSVTVNLEPQISNGTILNIPVTYQAVFKKSKQNGKTRYIPDKGDAIIKIPARETALVLIDTWDQGKEEPSSYMKNVAALLSFCRQSGSVIIHAPNHPVVDKYPQYHELKKKVEAVVQKHPNQVLPVFLSWPSLRNEILTQTLKLKAQGRTALLEDDPPANRDISRFLKPKEDEFVLASNNEYRYLLWQKQVKLIFYAGGATSECLLGRPTGFLSVAGRDDSPTGFTIVVVHDCTLPSAGANADAKTVQKTMMDYFERLAFVTTVPKLKGANPNIL